MVLICNCWSTCGEKLFCRMMCVVGVVFVCETGVVCGCVCCLLVDMFVVDLWCLFLFSTSCVCWDRLVFVVDELFGCDFRDECWLCCVDFCRVVFCCECTLKMICLFGGFVVKKRHEFVDVLVGVWWFCDLIWDVWTGKFLCELCFKTKICDFILTWLFVVCCGKWNGFFRLSCECVCRCILSFSKCESGWLYWNWWCNVSYLWRCVNWCVNLQCVLKCGSNFFLIFNVMKKIDN